MHYQLKPLIEVPPTARVLVPLSYGQKYHEGEKLRAYKDFNKQPGYENCQITILIPEVLEACKIEADDEAQKIKESKDKWQEFLDSFKTQSALKDGKFEFFLDLINKVPGVDGLEIYKAALEQVNNEYEKNEKLRNDILHDAKNAVANCSLEQSIQYLKTELALVLTLSKLDLFDVLLYPKAISRTLTHLYLTFNIEKPKYIQVENNQSPKKTPNPEEFFEKMMRASKNLPTPLKAYHKMLVDLLEANDINAAQLYFFAELVGNTANVYKGKFENQLRHKSMPITINAGPATENSTSVIRPSSV